MAVFVNWSWARYVHFESISADFLRWSSIFPLIKPWRDERNQVAWQRTRNLLLQRQIKGIKGTSTTLQHPCHSETWRKTRSRIHWDQILRLTEIKRTPSTITLLNTAEHHLHTGTLLNALPTVDYYRRLVNRTDNRSTKITLVSWCTDQRGTINGPMTSTTRHQYH